MINANVTNCGTWC